MIQRNVTRDEFVAAITAKDQFAKTFRAKCDMMQMWHRCEGMFTDNGSLMGAIVVTYSKHNPVVANLQLLHTFFLHRNKGVGRCLCEQALLDAITNGCTYFRVSSERDAVEFYRKLGLKFWGEQKSGCLLSVFKIGGPTYKDGIYDANDVVIQRACNSNRKGCVVKPYGLPH